MLAAKKLKPAKNNFAKSLAKKSGALVHKKLGGQDGMPFSGKGDF